VEEKVITGENVTHSMLHENKEVDALTRQFLWNID